MFENNVIGLKYNLILMFYYKEYTNYLVNINILEKLKFYTYKYFFTLKNIIILIKYIRIKYSVFSNNVFDRIELIKNNLFFYNFFKDILQFNQHNIDYDIFQIFIYSDIIYQLNISYYFIISYFNESFKSLLLMSIYNTHNNHYKTIQLNINKLKDSFSNDIFNELKTFNSFINIF